MLTSATAGEREKKHAHFSRLSVKQLLKPSSPRCPSLGSTLNLPLLKSRFLLGAISSDKREQRERKVDRHLDLSLPFVFLPAKCISSSSNTVGNPMCPCFDSILQLSKNAPSLPWDKEDVWTTVWHVIIAQREMFLVAVTLV